MNRTDEDVNALAHRLGGVRTSGLVLQILDDDEEIVPASPRMTGGF
jgi:hypothetical protein